MLAEITSTLGSIDGTAILAVGTEALKDQMRDFLAPVLLMIIMGVAIMLAVKRQTTLLISTILIFIVVAALFYAPDMLVSLGKSAGEANEEMQWQ